MRAQVLHCALNSRIVIEQAKGVPLRRGAGLSVRRGVPDHADPGLVYPHANWWTWRPHCSSRVRPDATGVGRRCVACRQVGQVGDPGRDLGQRGQLVVAEVIDEPLAYGVQVVVCLPPRARSTPGVRRRCSLGRREDRGSLSIRPRPSIREAWCERRLRDHSALASRSLSAQRRSGFSKRAQHPQSAGDNPESAPRSRPSRWSSSPG